MKLNYRKLIEDCIETGIEREDGEEHINISKIQIPNQ